MLLITHPVDGNLFWKSEQTETKICACKFELGIKGIERSQGKQNTLYGRQIAWIKVKPGGCYVFLNYC